MTLIISFAFAGTDLQKVEIKPTEDTHVRCKFVSPKNNIVIHQFKWDDNGVRCSYGIKVNDEVIMTSTAFIEDCKRFMTDQINKGSACMTNMIF